MWLWGCMEFERERRLHGGLTGGMRVAWRTDLGPGTEDARKTDSVEDQGLSQLLQFASFADVAILRSSQILLTCGPPRKMLKVAEKLLNCFGHLAR